MNYITQFKSLFKEIKSHSNIECNKIGEIVKHNKSAQATYVKLKFQQGYNIEKDFLECILLSRAEPSISFSYSYISPDKKKYAGGGEFNLQSLNMVLLNRKESKLWHDEMTKEEINTLKTFRIFDDHPDSGDFKLGVFSIQEDKNPPEFPDIYFYNRGDYYLMDIGYRGYLDALLDLIGVSNWQYLYCDVNMNKPKYKYLHSELHQTLKDLKFLFPNKNYSKYFKLLDSKQK